MTEYQQVNGTWVVLAVNYFAEDVPIAQLRTEGTVVNDPTLPDRLTPRDAGLLEGQQVYLRRAGETSSRLWSGTALLDGADFKSMVDAGAARFDPVLREQQRLRRKRAAKAEGRAGGDAAAKGPQSQPAGPSEVDAWIMYAQRFSDDYRLLDEQRATALRVVRQLLPQKQKIVAHTGPLRGSKEPKDVARVREGDLRIQRIFDHELKPRLMKIPTRTQVQEFEKRKLDRNRGAASAPSP